MKGTKKLVCLAMTLALASSVIGCGSKKESNTEGEVAETEIPKIEWMISNATGQKENFTEMTEEIEKATNVDLEWTVSGGDIAAHEEKIKLLITSDSLPDVLSFCPNEYIGKVYGPDGAFLNFADYLDLMPNFKKILEEDPSVKAIVTAGDGGIYALPQVGDLKSRFVPIIRQDILDELGQPMPTTYDELYEVLKLVKAKYPDMVGIALEQPGNFMFDLGVNFNTSHKMFYNQKDDKFEVGPTNEGARELLTYLNKLWNEGLLDPEFFTNNGEQFKEKFINGKVFFTLFYGVRGDRDKIDELSGGKVNYMVMEEPMTSKTESKKKVQANPIVNDWQGISVSAKTENPEAVVKMLDWLYTDEGYMLTRYGVEGVHYKKDGEFNVPTGDIKDKLNPEGTVDARDLNINMPSIYRYEKFLPEHPSSPEHRIKEMEVLKSYADKGYYYMADNGIKLSFNSEEMNDIKTIEPDLMTYLAETTINFVIGKRDLSEFDKFKEEVAKMGGDKLTEIYNAAYARYKDALK